jgi:hypothetical protein
VQLNRAKMPHPTTWTRVPGMGVAANAIDAAMQPLLVPAPSADVPARASQQVAVDGKTMRGTRPAGASHGVHLVSVDDVRQRVVLAQTRGAAKANEIAAAPALLAALPLRGVLVTGDAMDAQRQRSVQIVEAGGDSCWIVKEHQKRLYDDLRLLVEPQPDELPGTSAIPDDVVSVRTVAADHGLDARGLPGLAVSGTSISHRANERYRTALHSRRALWHHECIQRSVRRS